MKTFWAATGILALVLVILFFFGVVGRGCNSAVKATHIDDAVENYEEFQSIYNTCQQGNTDLCNIRGADEHDAMFQQFSKTQRIIALQANINRWVQEYDAKSKMWGRVLWKSDKLPFELSVNDFPCYNK